MIRAPISPDCATALATTMPVGQSSILATTPFALEANHDQLPNTGYINEFIYRCVVTQGTGLTTCSNPIKVEQRKLDC